jgi:hypothetical protein
VASCRDRIDWAAEHFTANEYDPRDAARVMVSQQCGVCAGCGSSGSDDSEMFVKKFEIAFGSKHHTIVKGLVSPGVLSAVAALLLVVGVAMVARRHENVRRCEAKQFIVIDGEMGNMDAGMLSESDGI